MRDTRRVSAARYDALPRVSCVKAVVRKSMQRGRCGAMPREKIAPLQLRARLLLPPA